jgi:hypothetical protein
MVDVGDWLLDKRLWNVFEERKGVSQYLSLRLWQSGTGGVIFLARFRLSRCSTWYLGNPVSCLQLEKKKADFLERMVLAFVYIYFAYLINSDRERK